jgi:hypothetical protein
MFVFITPTMLTALGRLAGIVGPATFVRAPFTIRRALMFLIPRSASGLVVLADSGWRWGSQSSFTFRILLRITFPCQARSIVRLPAELGGMSMTSAALTKFLLAWLIIALIKVMICVPAGSTLVIVPLAQLLPFVTLSRSSRPGPSSIGMVAAPLALLGRRCLGSIKSSRLLDDYAALGLLASLAVAAFIIISIVSMPGIAVAEKLLDTASFA